MVKTFNWSCIRQPNGEGVPQFSGQVDAHTLTEARALIAKEVADYAKVKLCKGAYLLSINTATRVFKDQHVFIAPPGGEA